MIDFSLNKEIIAQKREEVKNLSQDFAIKIQAKELELLTLKEKWYSIERRLKNELELFYNERKEHIQKYVDSLDLIDEKVIIPSKKVGVVKLTRISPKGNLILEIEIKEDNVSKTEQHPYHDVLFYRDYLDEQLKKILE